MLEILVPYFKAGLENNEFCMWVTSEPLDEREAETAMKKALPDFQQYLQKGQIEISPYTEWYLAGGSFDSERVLNGWKRKLDEALDRGYDGLRLTGNTFWLEQKDWKAFSDYEAAVDSVIGNYKMTALCTYSLEKCGASEVIDVVGNHQFALVWRERKWELIQSAQQKRTEKALEWESRVNAVLADLANFLVASDKPIAEIADRVLERAKKLTGSKHGFVTYIEPGTGNAVSYTLSQMLDLCRVQPEEKRVIVFPRGKDGRYAALWGHSLNTGVAFYTNSPRTHEASVGLPKGHIPVERFLSAPAMIAEERFGQIALANPREPYTDRDLDAVKRVAALYALALQRHRAQEELAKHQRDLERVIEARTAELVTVNRHLESEVGVRKRAEESLEERLRFERLFAELSARFVNLPAAELAEEIDRGLQLLVESLGVDRSTVYQFSEDMAELRITHSRAAEGIKPMRLGGVNTMFPWFTKKFREGGMVLYSGRQDLPEEAVEERAFVEREGIESYVSIPLAAGGNVLGAVAFVTFRAKAAWGEEMVQRLRLLAETVTGAIIRIRAEEVLRSKEGSLAEAQRIAHLGNWDWNIVTNALAWSDEVYRIFGLEPQEFGATYDAFLESVHPEDREPVKEAVNRSLADPNVHYSIEHRIIRPDGTQRVVHERGEVAFDKAGKPIRMIGTVHDITERKLDEEALRVASAYNRSLIEASLDPLVTIGRDGKITDVNAATEAVTGYSRGELIGTDFLKYFTEPDRARAGYEQVFREGLVRDYALEIRHRDGHITPVLYNASVYRDDAGQVVGVFAAARDITERKRAEEALRQSKDFLQTVIDGIPEPTMVIGRDRRVLLANRVAQALAGGDPVQEGLRCFQVLHHRGAPCAEPLDYCPLEIVIRTRKPALVMHKHYNENGDEIVVEANAAPILDASGDVIQIVKSCRDVSERLRTEEEMRKLRQELAHVGRVATMGQLAASLAHELNQPLTAISSNASAAQRFMDRTPPNLDEVREALEDIVKDGHRAGEVIRRLRALLKKGELERTPLEINGVVEEMVSLLYSEAVVKGVNMRMDLQRELLPVVGDRIQIQQVLMNLLMNGMEAMAGVGTESRELVVTTRPHDGDAVRVSVQDAGPGLSEESMAKLFTPFFTTKAEGMGMGLPIARSIVEAHGGKLWAANNPDRGATFHFTLPVTQEERV
jgi:PAS domain S-box-containing protein